MKGNLKGWNEFGIDPTTTYAAAGYDFYVPNLKTINEKQLALKAFTKSYNKSVEEIDEIKNMLLLTATAVYGAEIVQNNIENIVLLYLSLDSSKLNSLKKLNSKISSFVLEYLVFDTNKQVPGIIPQCNDHIKINSGIHVALEPETAGIFYNKSGMGTRGWDTRACVVDEDYAGIVHLSAAYTKKNSEEGKFYCGDKFSQMVVEVICRGEVFVNISEDEYKAMMASSRRGANAMGSSDVKH